MADVAANKRSRGRPKGIRVSSEDWDLIDIVESLASDFGMDFDTALRKASRVLKAKGYLTKSAAANTHAQRLRRIKRLLDAGHQVRIASLKDLIKVGERRHKK